MALIYGARGRYDEADVLLRKTLKLMHQDHVARAQAIMAFGQNCLALNDLDGAGKAVQLLKSQSATPRDATGMIDLAERLADHRLFETARSLGNRALDLMAADLGPNHQRVVTFRLRMEQWETPVR